MSLGTGIHRRRKDLNRRGATVIEYVTFAALVAGVVIVALEQIAPSTSATYTTLARDLNRRGPTTAGKEAPSVTPAVSQTAKPSPRSRLIWQTPVLAGLGILWLLLVLRRHRASKDAGDVVGDIEQLADKNSDARLFAKRQQILATLISDVRALTAGEVAVRHVMSSRLTTVEPSTSLKEVGGLMHEKKLRHMLVCDGGRLLGIISDRDLAGKTGRAAADVMTPSPLSVPSDTLLSPAVTLMMRKRISCLPVVDDGRLCGLFTTTDLIMTLQCAFQLLEKVAPHLTDQAKAAKPVSLRDSFTGLGEFAGDERRPQVTAVRPSANVSDAAIDADSEGDTDAVASADDVDAVEAQPAN
jgi:CBS domain-containing protein/Flp pilus assembly pilin Flp